ncbi:MAG: shikimate kinase [Butyribacter sp.]|nr:shikimate kinase [bacterium]MDY3853338.1 shikimate kinase [Butyribacter sp.]
MKNIILIGMPGAGKSTIGVVLAKKMGYHFIDSDLLIQEQEHMLLHRIIEEKGADVFKQIENKVNASIDTQNAVIATGGSVVYGVEAMMHLKSIGTIIYLKLPYDELEMRLGDLTKRGVVLKPGQELIDLYEERTILYERYADITVDCSQKQIRDIVERIALEFEAGM